MNEITSEGVLRELKLRNHAYDHLSKVRDHSINYMALDYLLRKIKDDEYSLADIKAMASGIQDCMNDREE